MYIITIYFSSGSKFRFDYSKENLDKMIASLRKHWTSTVIAGEGFGINFSQVTHYQVKETK